MRNIAGISKRCGIRSVEGSLAIDNVKAAEMIREKAPGLTAILWAGSTPLCGSLNVVLRRYEIPRSAARLFKASWCRLR
jgi:hypothetical protein